MKQKDKELLLKDLCARMPYFVECYCNNTSDNWCILTPVVISNLINSTENLILKPYLRPISSMTEEEKQIFFYLNEHGDCYDIVDFYNSHHFDYRGLIKKDLAIEVLEGMYNIK